MRALLVVLMPAVLAVAQDAPTAKVLQLSMKRAVEIALTPEGSTFEWLWRWSQ